VRTVERLLISHAPPYNKQLVHGALSADEHLVVVNAEAKGLLLPVVASVYFHNGGWPAPEA
jgi:hypothetical protein